MTRWTCLLAGGLFALPQCGLALDRYSADHFARLRAQKKMVLIQFYASHCSPCRQQARVLGDMERRHRPWWPVFLQADFDQEPRLRERYKVASLSTLLILKGEQVVGRSVGIDTDAGIRSFLRRSLGRSRAQPRARLKRPFRPRR